MYKCKKFIYHFFYFLLSDLYNIMYTCSYITHASSSKQTCSKVRLVNVRVHHSFLGFH